ncbi:hypothetical protein DL771_006055 [Monosporascus sp. 5C6A]|nr:hypothetical protein DL771_006055 [Monosporascus sp. 5C6A]
MAIVMVTGVHGCARHPAVSRVQSEISTLQYCILKPGIHGANCSEESKVGRSGAAVPSPFVSPFLANDRMRLLDTRNITVVDEFFENNTPEYAILSHTWGNEEVTFQDLQNSNAYTKSGYDKIKKTCETARKDGYNYAWVDTCCIDKSSSAELSEAINSMFRWYRQAAVCYVYLSDVDGNVDVSSGEFELRFSESKWFTRGWTLQELIAPSKLVFFTADWSPLRERAELSSLICRITGIAEKFLRNRGGAHIDQLIGQASIAERMSWASARQTTRIEDVAYSLLGIFEVNMPLLYGEGDRAFIRLQHEIARQSSDQSLFAWRYGNRTPDAGPRGIFAGSPAAFSGSGDIVPFEVESNIPPFSVTNRGLHITMPIYLENVYRTDLASPQS